jgi:hypothetical protein
VHVFLAETRAYYDLDRLWSDVPNIPIEAVPSVSVGPALTTSDRD